MVPNITKETINRLREAVRHAWNDFERKWKIETNN